MTAEERKFFGLQHRRKRERVYLELKHGSKAA